MAKLSPIFYLAIHPCLESLIQAVGRLQTELTTNIGALGVFIRMIVVFLVI